MIDQDKIAVMTRAAMAEKKNRREIFPAADFYMYDYVSFQVIKGLLGVTLFYALGVACWMAYTMDEWISTISLTELIDLALHYGKIYLLVAVVTAVILIFVYSLRYMRARQSLKEQQVNLKRLSRYYDKEDRKWGE